MTEQEEQDLKTANLPENWDGMLGVSYRYFCDEPKDAFEPFKKEHYE